ncbi:NAD(P)-binding protein [Thelephora terrestris]|uniref:NAD(P)-binding protein n=1 Tax=Thelephora terrestris TaxID=56493 RepID=A0A9P6H918_9AGAM|nr:NAD(P)-binding protein [Thelephora terrestris]
MSTDPTGKGLLLKADAIADTFREEIVQALKPLPNPPKLVGILATSAEPSRFYAEFTKKQCESLGFNFVLKEIGAALDPESGEGYGVEEAIMEANEDDTVDGIMVYYPIFGNQQDHYLQQVVSPLKDVEGLHFAFHYNLYHNIRYIKPTSLLAQPKIPSAEEIPVAIKDQPPPGTVKSILPCTPLAIVKCLEHAGVYNRILPYGDRAYGRVVTVINRSEVVGRPLAALLANDGARVFSVDIDSIQEYTKRPSSSTTQNRFNRHHVAHPSHLTLEECLAISDVVISAVPSTNYKVKTEFLRQGCVCLNIASEKNFEKDVRDKASIYLPSVGKVTIMMLLRNL